MQADLNLRWVHMLEDMFSDIADQIYQRVFIIWHTLFFAITHYFQAVSLFTILDFLVFTKLFL